MIRRPLFDRPLRVVRDRRMIKLYEGDRMVWAGSPEDVLAIRGTMLPEDAAEATRLAELAMQIHKPDALWTGDIP